MWCKKKDDIFRQRRIRPPQINTPPAPVLSDLFCKTYHFTPPPGDFWDDFLRGRYGFGICTFALCDCAPKEYPLALPIIPRPQMNTGAL